MSDWCKCKNWCSDRHDLDNEHHHRCKHWKPTQPKDPRFAIFGEEVWNYLKGVLPEFLGDEFSEDLLPLAEKAGLALRTKYDPEIHGEIDDCVKGDMIWFWGNEKGGAE